MSLKTDIILKNQFTVRKADGTGTRGSTPGSYVGRYMARELATEPIAPTRRSNLDNFVVNYMARSDAVEQVLADHRAGLVGIRGAPKLKKYDAPRLAARRLQRSAQRLKNKVARKLDRLRAGRREAGAVDLKAEFAEIQGDAGVSFGHNGVSLSHDQLHADAREIQEMFDKGYTVLKTILSFEHSYLLKHGIVPAGMDLNAQGEVERGDYRGNLDQLKLRLAIMNGMAHMGRVSNFETIKYVGVIQVDTAHAHCHLAIVDTGHRRTAIDGNQKGKLTAREMGLFRRGVDQSLDRHQKVAYLASSVNHQRRSVSAFVKRWAYESLSVSAQAQFVLACLPEDRSIWRANSNRREMAKANRLVRDMVLEHLGSGASPMPEAMAGVREYAAKRFRTEGLPLDMYERLIDDGRERIVTQAMNGVYTVLRSVADDELTVRTPMMGSMSTDFGELTEHVAASEAAGGKDMSAGYFALRLRSYTERLERHRALREDYLLRARSWEDADAIGRATEGSVAMYQHYVVEADYHSKALSKYQHYLDLGGARTTEWTKQWAKVNEAGQSLVGLRSLRRDASIAKMSNVAAAETVGREIYGHSGGGGLAQRGPEGVAARELMDSRIEQSERAYRLMVDDLVESWRKGGPAIRMRSADPAEAEASKGEVMLSPGSAEMLEIMDHQGPPSLGTPGAAVFAAAAPEYEFETVKGIDIHELGLDWSTDKPVGPRTGGRFITQSEQRLSALRTAEEWMVASGQGDSVAEELGAASADIDRMRTMAAEIAQTSVLRSALAQAALASRLRRERERKEREALAQADLDESAALLRTEIEAEDVVRAQLSETMDAERRLKQRGATARIDSGLGGALNASINAAVRSWRPQDVDLADE